MKDNLWILALSLILAIIGIVWLFCIRRIIKALHILGEDHEG